jgi:transposase
VTMTTAASSGGADPGVVPDDDPTAKPSRRRFSAAYKLAIVAEYERLTDAGAKGALLRREGLYTSHLVDWRRARDAGALAELAPKARGPQGAAVQHELERLRRRNTRLEEQLAKHRQALEVQGKASELLSRLLAESAESSQQPDRRQP